MYVVLVLLFKSFSHPITIQMALPLALGGAFGLLLITGTNLSMPALIGLLALRRAGKHEPVLNRRFLEKIGVQLFKNLFGAVLVVGGLIMFITPGQGILTLVAGILLLNFPGKRRFEVWLVGRKPVHRAIDWIRRRAGRPPILLPADQSKIG
jgi:hypothetical protein